jgi:hypothetical protein
VALPFHSDQIIVQLLYRGHFSFRTLCASPRWAYSFATQCVSYFMFAKRCGACSSGRAGKPFLFS